MVRIWNRYSRKILVIVLLLSCMLPQTATVLAVENDNAPQWAGVWLTNKYGHELRLQQIDHYVFGVAEGVQVVGIADDYSRTFYGTWYIGSDDGSMGVRSGPLRLVMSPDNKRFDGQWDGTYSGTLNSRTYGPWPGTWETSYGRIWLQGPSGNNVWGGYDLKDGSKGWLTATINGNVLSGTWQEGCEWGLFEFTMDPLGDKFTGWRNTSSNPWTGKRR